MSEITETIKIEFSKEQLSQIVNLKLGESVEKAMDGHMAKIGDQIKDFFIKADGRFIQSLPSNFDRYFDWAVEEEFRKGLTKAMDELKFSELVYKKSKQILSDPMFIKKIAEQKVKASLGLSEDVE